MIPMGHRNTSVKVFLTYNFILFDPFWVKCDYSDSFSSHGDWRSGPARLLKIDLAKLSKITASESFICHVVGALSKALDIVVWILGPDSTDARIVFFSL